MNAHLSVIPRSRNLQSSAATNPHLRDTDYLSEWIEYANTVALIRE